MKRILYILILFAFSTPAHSQWFDKIEGGESITKTRNRDTLYIDLDTIAVRPFTTRLIDSVIAAGGAVDTTQFVSMNRDDPDIRGEKTFLGVTAFKPFGQFSLSGGSIRAWWASHDTATKRLGDTVLTTSSVGTGQHTMQLYSSGIFDLPKQSSVRAFVDGNTAHGIADTVVFDAETFDTQSEFNTANGEFIARQAGVYLISVQVASTLSSSTSSLEIRIRKDYSNYSISGNSPLVNSVSNWTYAQYTDLVSLGVGGSIKIQLSASHTGTIQGDVNGEQTFITILKVM